MIKLKIERRPEASKFDWGKVKEYLADGLVILFGVWLFISFGALLDWWLDYNWRAFKDYIGSGDSHSLRNHCSGNLPMAESL